MGPSFRRKGGKQLRSSPDGAGSYSSYVCTPGEVLLLCYLMGEIRQVHLYSEGKVYLLLVSALASSAIPCLGTL